MSVPGAAESRWVLPAGSLFGIPLRVHATSLLLLPWLGTLTARAGGGFMAGVLLTLLLLVSVAVHELGHALVARRLGLRTREIVLYPVGGVTRIEGQPRGLAELAVALAGPAASLLLALLLVVPASAGTRAVAGEGFTPGDLTVWLLVANLLLFAVNLVPAFPLDGGRALRALLSLGLPPARATRLATAVGQSLAVAAAIAGLLWGQPVLVLVALVVFLGATQEAAASRRQEVIGGRPVRDALVVRCEVVAPQDVLEAAAKLLLRTPQEDFPVVDGWRRVVGVLARARLVAALASRGPETPVLEVMDRAPVVTAPEADLVAALPALLRGPVLVVEDGRFVGMVTRDSVDRLAAIMTALAAHRPAAQDS